MPLSHHCLGCGNDLTRIRARIDDVLRLPVVLCARCGRAATRRPLSSRGWRRLRYAVGALAIVAVNVMLLLPLSPLALNVGEMLADGLIQLSGGHGAARRFLADRDRLVPVIGAVAVMAAMGLYVGIAFSHLRRHVLLPGLLAWFALFVAFIFCMESSDERAWPRQSTIDQFIRSVAGIGVGSVVILPFLELGRGLRRQWARRRDARWRKALAARRARR